MPDETPAQIAEQPDPAGVRAVVQGALATHVDKLLVCTLIMFIAGAYVHASHHQPMDTKIAEVFGAILNNLVGGLLTLLTGGTLAAALAAKKNGK